MPRIARLCLARLSLIVAMVLAAACSFSPVSPSAVEGADRGRSDSGSTGIALASASTSDPVALAKPWIFDGVEGRKVATNRYFIHTTITDSGVLSRVSSFIESALDHYVTALGPLPKPSEPMNSFLFANREQWATYTKQRLPEDAETYLKIGRGGFTTGKETVFYDIGGDTYVIAAHEGWHQYTQTTFKHGLPIWLEEGIATYMEGHGGRRSGQLTFRPWQNMERFRALRRLVEEDRIIPLTRLVNGSPQSFLNEAGRSPLLSYYAQVWALVHFLNEGEGGKYSAALREVIQDAAEGRLAGRLATSTNLPNNRSRRLASSGRGGPWVLLVYFNRDLDQMEKEYEAFVRRIAVWEHWRTIERGDSPLTTPPDPTVGRNGRGPSGRR